MYYDAQRFKRNENPQYDNVTLIMESPNGHREYQAGERWNMEQFINEDGFFVDRYGFKWKAWIEG